MKIIKNVITIILINIVTKQILKHEQTHMTLIFNEVYNTTQDQNTTPNPNKNKNAKDAND